MADSVAYGRANRRAAGHGYLGTLDEPSKPEHKHQARCLSSAKPTISASITRTGTTVVKFRTIGKRRKVVMSADRPVRRSDA